MVQDVMRQHFATFAADGWLFRTPVEDGVDPLLYTDLPDEEEWVAWMPKGKTAFHDLRALEEELKVRFHPSIHEYFNSYWFMALEGFVDDYEVELEPVAPRIELSNFE